MNTCLLPQATKEMEQQLFHLLQYCPKNYLVKGANEVNKSLRRNQATLVLLAGDTVPLEIIHHLPLLCEDYQVPYVYVSSKIQLGRALQITRPVIACALLVDNPFQAQLENLKKEIEKQVY